MVDLEDLEDADAAFVSDVITRHVRFTGSTYAADLLKRWARVLPQLVKVMPRDYKRVLVAEARARSEQREPKFEDLVGAAHG